MLSTCKKCIEMGSVLVMSKGTSGNESIEESFIGEYGVPGLGIKSWIIHQGKTGIFPREVLLYVSLGLSFHNTLAYLFQLAIIASRINLIGYDSVTAQSLNWHIWKQAI